MVEGFRVETLVAALAPQETERNEPWRKVNLGPMERLEKSTSRQHAPAYPFFTDAPMVAGIHGEAEMASEVIGDTGAGSTRIGFHCAAQGNQP